MPCIDYHLIPILADFALRIYKARGCHYRNNLETAFVEFTSYCFFTFWVPWIVYHPHACTVRFKFGAEHSHLKIPHMGWNEVHVCRDHPLVADWNRESRFYFVHSYHVVAKEMDAVLATTEYGVTIHSILGRGNIMGAQFHPEKSHKFGLQLLKNFAERDHDPAARDSLFTVEERGAGQNSEVSRIRNISATQSTLCASSTTRKWPN